MKRSWDNDLKFERASRSLAKTGSSFWSFLVSFVGVFFRVLFGCLKEGSQKWFKINQKEVQKGYLEKGTKKAPKMMIFMTLECGSSIVNNCKIDDFDV